MASSDKTLILGVGNTLRQDDGIGPIVINQLKEENLNNVDLIDGGTDGLTLFEYIKKYQNAIIIDAVEMGHEPGEIKLFTPAEVKLNVVSDTLSTHGFGLKEIIELMQSLEVKTNLKIIGIQPKSIDYGEGLTSEISTKVEKVKNLVKENI